MAPEAIWICGSSRSGKTTRLIQQFETWAKVPSAKRSLPPPSILVFAATGDNRLELADRIEAVTHGRYFFDSRTPQGFFQDEVILFFPLLAKELNLKVQFPLRLRPETEQELATALWRSDLDSGRLRQEGVSEYFVVRHALDLLQLTAVSGTPPEDIPTILKDGLEQQGSPELWDCMGEALMQWRSWCLERGLLTYGIVNELYWRYLLPHPTYQTHLKKRYRAFLADDVDEYPAIAHHLFTFLLDHNIPGCFTYNPNGGIRWGLGADPHHLETLSERCSTVEDLTQEPGSSIGSLWGESLIQWVSEPMLLPELPSSIQTIQTVSRSQLLRQTADTIIQAVYAGEVQPQEIAVLGAGVDAIARYTLREILTSRGIPVESLNDQQPLASSPMIRALLTLLALVYPHLGRLLDRESVAEMLVVLSQAPGTGERSTPEPPRIDPVRAGLLTDFCFAPDLEQPQLLPATTFPRWDRLGFQASQAYEDIRHWIETQHVQQQQRLIPSPVTLLDRAIQRFLYGGSFLPSDQLAILRELIETAQHYWDVDSRLRVSDRLETPYSTTVGQFIQLLRNGTITADPYPVRPIAAQKAVTLATLFQYRANRCSHRWQFWLDASSSLWLTGGAPLFGAPLLLHDWSGRTWTPANALEADQQRLQRQILDLSCRVSDRIYLCHSDLATSGQEQTGSLLTLVNSALPVG